MVSVPLTHLCVSRSKRLVWGRGWNDGEPGRGFVDPHPGRKNKSAMADPEGTPP
jgi:hypothetical protein